MCTQYKNVNITKIHVCLHQQVISLLGFNMKIGNGVYDESVSQNYGFIAFQDKHRVNLKIDLNV